MVAGRHSMYIPIRNIMPRPVVLVAAVEVVASLGWRVMASLQARMASMASVAAVAAVAEPAVTAAMAVREEAES